MNAAAVARLRGPGGVVGGGFLVGPAVVATCAHVVADALLSDPYSPDAPEGPIPIDFPFGDGVRREAVVERWAPITDDGTGDIALLRLVGPPPDVPVPPLRRVERLWDRAFRVVGFPAGHPGGVWSSGVFRGGQSLRWSQLQSTPGRQRIEGGFSGAPVWDERSGAVVGMTVAADRGDTTTAFLIPIDQVLALDPALLPCPYRGLAPFGEEHAATFFGRDADNDRLVAAVAQHPLVAVAGPSGAGKSSLVHAGLVPRLRAEGTPVVAVRAQAGTDLARLLPARYEPGSVLVIDQFEELAALDPDGARHVLDQVVRLTADEPVRAVLTVRWAALDEVVTPELMAPLEAGSVLVAPMGRGALREVIVGPTDRSPGLELEPGLVERILDDAGTEPGRLPLVASLLTDLWDRRDGNRLTVAAYEAVGGVAGAVAAHAERAISRMDAAGVDTVRRLFLALTRPDRDGRFVRRAVPVAELPPEQRELLPPLMESRLVVATGDGGATVEPAHQAVIDHWPRLRAWLDEDRAFLSWRDRVDAERERWESEDRANAALLRGTALAEAADWLPARAADVATVSVEYLDRSRARQRFEVRRWRVVAAVLAVLGLVAATLAVVAADRRQTLSAQLATANAGSLARESQSRSPTDAVLGAQLALAAHRSDPDHPQARSALAAAFLTLQSGQAELADLGPAAVTELVAAGDTAVAIAAPHAVALTGLGGPRAQRLELPGIGADHTMALSPDGTVLADVPPDFSRVHLRDVAELAAGARSAPSAPGARVDRPRFSPDGSRLSWLELDTANTLGAAVWDPRSGDTRRIGPLTTDALDVRPTPDPDLVLVTTRVGTESGSAGYRVALWSLSRNAEVAGFPPGAVVVRSGAGVLTCTEPDLDSAGPTTATVTVTPVAAPGTAAEPLRITLDDFTCDHRISADAGHLVERAEPTGSVFDTATVFDLADGSARTVDLPRGVLDQGDGLAVANTVTVLPGRPATVLAAQHGSVLRLATHPRTVREVGSADQVGRLSDDGRFLVHVRGSDLVVADAQTDAPLATLPGAAAPGSVWTVDSAVWLSRSEPARWVLTRYELPTLRTVVSYPLPTSADPLPTAQPSLGIPTGQGLGVSTYATPDGPRTLSVTDGMLAVLDGRTGQPLAGPTRLGASPAEHRFFQRGVDLRIRPGHDGQVVLVGPDNALQLWDAWRGTRMRSIPTGYRPLEPGVLDVPRFAIDPSGARLAVLTPQDAVETWDLDTGEKSPVTVAVPSASTLAGFTADGHLVVEVTPAGAGRELRLLDLDGGREAGSMVVPGVVDALTEDGTGVKLTSYRGARPWLLPLTPDGWREHLCSVIGRPYNAAERGLLPPGADQEPPCA